MNITRVNIKNYRNLNDLSVELCSGINFVLGDNNTGKSNFLDLLKTLFNPTKIGFESEDFFKKDKVIEIGLSLQLNDREKGLFDDHFDPTNMDLINIIATQGPDEEGIVYRHKESGEELNYSKFYRINFFKYDSVRKPEMEFTFYKNYGAGRFLNYLAGQNIPAADQSAIDLSSIKKITDDTNILFKDLLPENLELEIGTQNEINDLILRILTIKDADGNPLENAGYGTQFTFLIVLDILEKLLRIKKRRDKETGMLTDENANRSTSLILGIDEPEIHLHPFMQRNLMRFICELVISTDSNLNKQSAYAIRKLFEIDEINGQVIIVTHSPDIIIDFGNSMVYNRIIRFYKENSKTIAVSGHSLKLDKTTENNLYRLFQDVKGAFFSKKVVVIEGDTESGAFPIWFNKLTRKYLDDYGIAVLSAHGGGRDGVRMVQKLLDQFKIPNIGVADRDLDTNITSSPELVMTDKRDFEEELVESIIDKPDVIHKLFLGYNGNKKCIIQINKLSDISKKYGINNLNLTTGLDLSDLLTLFEDKRNSTSRDLVKTAFLAWLDVNKSILLGRYIGESLDKENIPKVYADFLSRLN